ncbi:unnamed protein product [Amaranthus hypochondriacus]
MAKVFLTCFAPFKPFSSDELAVGLLSSLVDDLQRLEKSLEENPLSLHWCSEAMFFMKKIHTHFLLDFEKSKDVTSWEAIELLDEYMSATLDVLDLCNLLKSAISSLDRYRLMIDFTAKRLNDVRRSKFELERIEKENYNKFFYVKKLRDMNLNKEGLSKVKLKTTRRTNVHVLQAIRFTMSIISLFIFVSILHPNPIKIDKGFYFQLCRFDSSPHSIQKLVTAFCKKFQNAQVLNRSVLAENAMIEDAFIEFKGRLEDSSFDEAKSLEMLKKRALDLKEGLDLFEYGVNELFENVIEGRKRVINLITFKNNKA